MSMFSFPMLHVRKYQLFYTKWEILAPWPLQAIRIETFARTNSYLFASLWRFALQWS
jgi:hypothetical protein